MPFQNKNTGFGLDFGAQYQVNDKINISASLIDLGYIDWKENTEQIGFDDVNYSFKGFELLDLIDGKNSDSEDFFQDELDSLESLYTPTEAEGIAYRSSIVSKFYTGVDYQLGEKHRVGANVYGRIANGSVTPEFGAFYNLLIGRVVNAVISGSMRNGKVSSVGIGFSVNMGPIQLYATTESATSFINPEAAHLVDGRFGINLTFGRKKKSKEEEIIEELEEEQAEEIEDLIEEEPVEQVQESLVPAAAVAAAAVVPAKAREEEFEEEPIIEKAPEVVVRRGRHKDELDLGYYVVVGAFLSRLNAQKYSNMLKMEGYDNEFGYLTERAYYYVTVYKNDTDIEAARNIRDDFRKKNLFEFPDSWLLSVVE
jgi:cell division septation protein DedD